jgi:hypothetical protein
VDELQQRWIAALLAARAGQLEGTAAIEEIDGSGAAWAWVNWVL